METWAICLLSQTQEARKGASLTEESLSQTKAKHGPQNKTFPVVREKPQGPINTTKLLENCSCKQAISNAFTIKASTMVKKQEMERAPK